MSALKSMSQSLKKPAKFMKKKHKKLDEDWFDTREPIQDGMRFSAKYLGATLVDEPKGKDVSSAAVQRIINNMSKGAKKQTVQLIVSEKGIKIYDLASSQLKSDVSINRISFCASMKQHMKVFAYVAQNADNGALECHAYLCNSVKEAQSLTVTVAQSFRIAFELTEDEPPTEEKENEITESDFIELNGDYTPQPLSVPIPTEKRYQRFSSESNPFDSCSEPDINTPRLSSPDSSKNSIPEEQKSTPNGIPSDIFIFTSPLPSSPQQPTTPKSNEPITPIRPPPANTRQSDKSQRRPSRPTSVGILLPSSPAFYQMTPSPSNSAPVVEDWDQGFADLALSRTQEKRSSQDGLGPETPTEIMYPPSNPFFSPGNPFTA